MKGTELIASCIANAIQDVAWSEDSMVVNIGGLFWQTAGFGERTALVEVAGNEVRPKRLCLDVQGQQRMLDLGFTEPTDEMPNWWIGVEDDRDQPAAAGHAVVTALCEMFGVDVLELARKVGLTVELGDQPTRIPPSRPTAEVADLTYVELDTMRGRVRLASNGTATLEDGTPWSDLPVAEWDAYDDGRIFVGFNKPDGDSDWFPWMTFTPDTPEMRQMLSAFCPSKAQILRLRQRLALMEHMCLETIMSGEPPGATEYGMLRDLTRLQTLDEPDGAGVAASRQPALNGWVLADRFNAADRVVYYLGMLLSADRPSEYWGDIQGLFTALQAWVHVSPWKDELPFAVLVRNPGLFCSGVALQRIRG